METFAYNPMDEYNNILSPNIYDASSLSSAFGTNGLSGLGQGGMSFSGTGNPLVNNFSNQITDGFSINNSVTPSFGSAFQSFRDGDVGLSDLGGMLGSRAKSFGQGIGSDISNNEFYQQNHGNLSAQNQFGNLWGGLQALAGLYGGFKQSRLADKQFDMQKDAWNKSWDANKKQVNEAVSSRAGLKFGDNTEKRAEYTNKYSV